jgi:glucuronosyltransferase
MNSYLEASFAGKPILAIPFFVDQFYNADCILHNEVGVYVDKTKVSAQYIVDALNEVLIDNSKYAKNAKELANMLKDRPGNVKDELIRYVEYSAKHPRLAEFLQLESVDMPIWKLYSVDIILFLLGCTLVFVFSLVFAIQVCMNFVRQKVSKPKRE